MKLGIRGHDLGIKGNLKELARSIKEGGFTGIQLVLHKVLDDFSLDRLNEDFAREVREIFQEQGVDILMLGAYFNIIDGKKAQKDIERFKLHLKYAKDFGCSFVGSETGSYVKGRVYHEPTYSEEALATVIETVRELVNYAEEQGSTFAIEGAWYHVIRDCQRMKYILDEIDSDHLKVTFDLYNLVNIDNYQNQRQIIDEAFDLYGDKIVLIHAKDFVVDGDKLKQVALGDGIYDYPYLMNKLKEQNRVIPIIFEGVTGDENIKRSYAFINQMIDEHYKQWS